MDHISNTQIERILGLPLRSLSDPKFLALPETKALIKILIAVPWLLEVAEYGYDPEILKLIMQREAFNLKLIEAKKKYSERRDHDRSKTNV